MDNKNIPSKNANILVVDDQDSVRRLLSKYMEKEGYLVDRAANGIDAIELAKYNKYHLILLDVIMPGIDGFEVCKRIKSSGKSKNTPIIFVTGKNEDAADIKGYGVGSVDYITKPINMNQLILKAAVHVKSSMLMDKLEIYRGRMQADIKKANSFYHAFLPSENEIKFIQNSYSVNIDSYFLPYNEIGGDFWKIINIDKNQFGVLYVDFSGHGVASALNVAYLNAILSHDIKWEKPIEVISFINDHLSKVLQDSSFATAIYCVFNKKKQSIKYINCSAPYPILISKENDSMDFYNTSYKPLGIWPSKDLNLNEDTINLKHGEIFLIYSDVLLESLHSTNDRWMMDGLKHNILSINSKNANLLGELYKSFISSAKQPLTDDLTMISIQNNVV